MYIRGQNSSYIVLQLFQRLKIDKTNTQLRFIIYFKLDLVESVINIQICKKKKKASYFLNLAIHVQAPNKLHFQAAHRYRLFNRK